MGTASKNQKALFLDRDGTLIKHIPYLSDPEKVELLPKVKESLHAALKSGILLFLLTNQSGIGRGWFSLEAVHACNQRMLDLLALPSPGFTGICIAPEAPTDPVVYRKPSPRFILEMIDKYHLNPEDCYMIGDQPVDLETAHNSQIIGIGIQQPPLYPNQQNVPSVYEFINNLLTKTL